MTLGPSYWLSLSPAIRQRIEDAHEAEQASCVVRGAKPDHRAFWQRIEAQRSQQEAR